MKYVLFNGSPRGKNGNTQVLLNQFIQGLASTGTGEIETVLLAKVKETEQHVHLFCNADHVILAFPLYTDAMPGIVKYFIEAAGASKVRNLPSSLGFIVQSGFPEPHHSRYVQRYMERWTRRLGCLYLGTIVRGGAEGIRMMPPIMTRKLLRRFRQLGVCYGRTGHFDTRLIKKLAFREKPSAMRVCMMKHLRSLGFLDIYWNMQMKHNGALDMSFQKPYDHSTE